MKKQKSKTSRRAFKYRLYPKRKQEKKMNETLETCRKTYNELLEINQETYQHTGKGLTKFDMNKCKCGLGVKTNNVHSQVVQNVSDRVSKAYQNFFRRVKQKKAGKNIKVGYPRFKKDIKSFTYPQHGFKMNGSRIFLSNIGKVKIRIGKKQNKIEGKLKTLTIKKYPSGKWFAIFTSEINIKPKKHKHPNRKIGIDVGLEKFATLSDGTMIENPRFLIESEQRLKTLNRRLSRKNKGSKRRLKARHNLACLHEKIANQRHDFVHKFTRYIVNEYGVVAVEDLNIKGMVRHPYLAKHINDASWGTFVRILEYKVESTGSQVEKVSPNNTSQICSQCGNKVLKTLAVRWHRCPVCGLNIDRDENSAINILQKSTVGTTESYAHGDESPLLASLEDSSSMKCEAHVL